jgi:homoserine kinase
VTTVAAGGAALVRRAARVEVPATIANLGAGYDCLGLAVDLSLSVSVKVRDRAAGAPPVAMEVEGEDAADLVADPSNRVVLALMAGLGALGLHRLAGIAWQFGVRNEIPLERGLGSSAAATIAGLCLAEALAGRPLGPGALLELATEIEGHPDNVAPALLGGFVASLALDARVEAVRLDPPAGLGLVAWIPDRRLVTAEMRRVLPATVPRADAVANLARVAVAVAGLAAGRVEAIGLLAGDRLHEPYRAAAYPELPEIVEAARAAGALGACLAGSGSTIVAFVDTGTGHGGAGHGDATDARAADAVGAAMRNAATRLGLAGRLAALAPRTTGARLLA